MLDLLNQYTKGPQANKTTTAEDVLFVSQSDAVDEFVKKQAPSLFPSSHSKPARNTKPSDKTSSTRH